MLPSFSSDTITRVRPGIQTVRGQDIPDWSTPPATTKDIAGCSVQPASTSLSEDGRILGIMDGLTVYCPPGADVQAGDHIIFNSETYEINGEPRAWKSATGMVSHIQLNLKRYSG